MVMRHDDRGGVHFYRFLEYLTDVGVCPIHGAVVYIYDVGDGVSPVEKKEHEAFFFQIAHEWHEIVCHIG